MGLADRKLVNWLREMGEDITEHVGPFALLKLFQSTAGDTNHILTIELSDELRSNPDILAQRIWDTAEHEISTAYGVEQRFMVCAFRQDQEAYERRYPFKLTKHRTLEQQLDGESVPANETGLTQQMLRHDSESHRHLMLMSGAYAERAEATIDRLTKQLSGLEDRHIKVIMLQEELLDRKAQRELQNSIELSKAKQIDRMKEMVIPFLPLMFSKLLGGRMISREPMAAVARDMAVSKYMQGLTEEEFSVIYAGLKPENKAAFIELFKSYKQDDVDMQAGKPEILRDPPADEAN
jgi:hypothetical protein